MEIMPKQVGFILRSNVVKCGVKCEFPTSSKGAHTKNISLYIYAVCTFSKRHTAMERLIKNNSKV